jgi:glycosyltransferase involved in cell wall biosynthesis
MFNVTSQEVRDQKRKDLSCAGKKVVGIIARLADIKGHCFLIDAIDIVRKTVPDVKLLIIGMGKEEGHLKEQVRRLNLEDYISFYPEVNRSAEFLGIFDCFVLPSLEEGLGLSVMEAQAAGLPVIASRIGGIPSLIDDGQNGLLVNPGRAEELSQAIIRVLSDPDLAKLLGTQAREKAVSEYGVDKMAEKIIKIYENVKRHL